MAGQATKDDGSGHVPGGWVLLSRALRDSDVWSWDSEHIRLWIYLRLSVNARRGRLRMIGGVEVGYGQILKSYRAIAEENEHVVNRQVKRWRPSRVDRMLHRFKDAEMVSLDVTELGTLITIKNFKRYQEFSSYRAEVATEVGTVVGRRGDNNNQNIALDQLPHSPRLGVEELWQVWLEELGGPPRYLSCTRASERTSWTAS